MCITVETAVNDTEDTINKMKSTPSLLDAALAYGQRGWKVFPVVPRGKAPLTHNGFKDASSDAVQIRQWWTRWPYANIGLALDEATVVIDVDPRNGGEIPIEIVPTLEVDTGGHGKHFYYTRRLSDEPRALRKSLVTGVDIKSRGGYVLLPPSFTERQYVWADSGATIETLTEELEALIVKPDVVIHPYDYDPEDNRPGTLYNKQTLWSDLLIPDGYTLVDTSSDGEQFWTRPGKTNGISATTNYNGSDLLFIFSTATTLSSGEGYTKFRYLVETKYGGDYSLAAKSISLQGASTAIQTTSNLSLVTPPKGYEFDTAFSQGSFVSDFIEYVSAQTDAPLEYAEAAALVCLSVAGYRCKANLAPYPGGLSNNLYVLLVGETTVSRKSTVQRIASQMIKSVMPPSVLPNRSKTEALIKSLANRSGVPSVWTPDEFGVTLAQIYQRDFMAGLEEMLLTVYSGDDYQYERVLDTVTIRSPHLSVLAAATPESLARAGATALDSGLLPRFAIVYPQVMPESRAVGQAKDMSAIRQNLISRLHAIVSWSDSKRDITFSEEALNALNSAESDLIGGAAARLPTMLYKVAALAAISEQSTHVRLSHAQSAITVVRRWGSGVTNIVPEMYRHSTDQQFDLQLDYILQELEKAGGVLSRVQVANLLNVRKQRLDDIQLTLEDKGKIRRLDGSWYLQR